MHKLLVLLVVVCAASCVYSSGIASIAEGRGVNALSVDGPEATLEIDNNGARATVRISLSGASSCSCPVSNQSHQGLVVPGATTGVLHGSVFGVTDAAFVGTGEGEGSASPTFSYGWLVPAYANRLVTMNSLQTTFSLTIEYKKFLGQVYAEIHYTGDQYVQFVGTRFAITFPQSEIPSGFRPQDKYSFALPCDFAVPSGEGGLVPNGFKTGMLVFDPNGMISMTPGNDWVWTGYFRPYSTTVSWRSAGLPV